METPTNFHIGCQGWNYPDWVTKPDGETIFYPRGMRSGEMLEAYGAIYDTVEVDSTFYAVPAVAALENWFEKTPNDFTFSLKLPQEITHKQYLRESSFELLDQFCERISLLGKKLALVLIQLPPQFEADKDNARNLRTFLGRLPGEIRFSVEFRNRSWMVEWTYEELARNNVSLCFVEGGWIPRELMFEAMTRPTSAFTYTRFMGDRDLTDFSTVIRPQDENLIIWKEKLEKLRGRDNFIYFSNFYEGFAPAATSRLKALFGQIVQDPGTLERQKSLF